jgi:hypothetical protein
VRPPTDEQAIPIAESARTYRRLAVTVSSMSLVACG